MIDGTRLLEQTFSAIDGLALSYIVGVVCYMLTKSISLKDDSVGCLE